MYTFITKLLLILTISVLVSNLIDYYLVNGNLESLYSNTNVKSDNGTSNNSSQPSQSGTGHNNPQPPKDGLVVTKNPDDHDSVKSKGIPQSTSNNSISSEVSYTSTDLALAAELDKQNFSNVVKQDTAKATDLFNQQADELAKVKSELAKLKKSERLTFGLKIIEERPF